MKRCERCTHYRPQRSLVEALRLGNTLELTEMLERVMQTEQSLVAKEEGFKMELLKADRDRWRLKPQVQAYCAVHEDQDVYFVPEIKNPNHRCEEFDEDRDGASLPCDTCAHHQPPPGFARDHQNVMDAISPANVHSSMSIDGQDHTQPCSVTQDLQGVMQVSGKGQAHEMLLALTNGTLLELPQYYAHCTKYSARGKYVICRMQNPHDRCRGHSMAVPLSGTGVPAHIEPSRPASAPSHDVEERASRRPRSTFFQNLARRLVQDMDNE